MKTITRKLRANNSESKTTMVGFMDSFYKFPKAQQLKIAEQINQSTFSQRWALLDKELPNIEMNEAEIMNEVRAVRYGKTKNKNSA